MQNRGITRRHILKMSGVAGMGLAMVACQPKIVEVEKVVEKVITHEVEKEVVRRETVIVSERVVQEVTPTPQPRQAGQTVVIRYGTFWPMLRIEYMNQGLAVFHQENPDIKVTIEMGGGVYRDKLTTQMAAGTEPDTGITDTYAMRRFYDAGLILDMMPSFEKAGIDVLKEYTVLGHEMVGNKLFGVPWTTYSHGLFYNKQMFTEFGVPDPYDDLGGYWSFDQFTAALRKIKEASGGKVFPLSVDLMSLDYSAVDFIYGMCGQLYDFVEQQYTFSYPRTIAAIEYLVDLYHEGLIIDAESASATEMAGMLDPFSGGAVAIYKGSTGIVGQTTERVGDRFQWDIARCPTTTGAQDETVSYVSADSNYASSRTKYPEESAKLLMFLAGDVMQGILSKARVGMCALKRALRIEGGFLTPPPTNIGMMLEPWDTGRFVPRLVHYNALACTKIPTREMEYVLQGQKTVEEACNTMDQDMNPMVEFKEPFVPQSEWLLAFPGSVASCK